MTAGDGRRSRRAGWAAGLAVLVLLALALAALLRDGSHAVGANAGVSLKLPTRPGLLLRSEAFTRGIPAAAEARRILYTTTTSDGAIVAASALVLTPRGARGPHPVVLWMHGTTGVAQSCAPSLLPDPFAAGVMNLVAQAIGHGWTVVAPDYEGMGVKGPPSYLLGRPEARSALDAVRAARQLRAGRAGPQTLVWGHSQGGGAALWVGIEARRYAPDVPLAGIAAMAPASDLVALRARASGPFGVLLAAYVLDAYSHTYSDVRWTDYVRPSARSALAVIARGCVEAPATLAALAGPLAGPSPLARNPASGPLGRRLAQNTPRTPSGVPTLIAQGLADQLIDPAVQLRFVGGLCRAGAAISYRTYAGRDHLGLISEDSPLVPELLRFSEERLRGAPAPTGCSSAAG